MNNFLRRPFQYRYTNVSLVLIGINVLVFIFQVMLPRTGAYLALNPIAILRFHFFWQFATYMFAHGGVSHLLFNMIALFLFGTAVERRMGSAEFLLYYMATGILAGLFSFVVFFLTGQNASLLGASGALFAVQLAYATLLPDSIIYIWGIIPLRAPVMVLVFTAIELFSTLTGFSAGVAHLTHLAGFAFGWLYFLVRYKFNPLKTLIRRR